MDTIAPPTTKQDQCPSLAGPPANIRPISYVKTHAAKILQQINVTRNPIVITQNGLAKGEHQSINRYREARRSGHPPQAIDEKQVWR